MKRPNNYSLPRSQNYNPRAKLSLSLSLSLSQSSKKFRARIGPLSFPPKNYLSLGRFSRNKTTTKQKKMHTEIEMKKKNK